MIEIKLPNEAIALVDEFNLSKVNLNKWHVSHNGYAIRRERIGITKKIIYMHKVIFGDSGEFDVDHIDGNKLNNCQSNLRLATRSLNNANSKPRIGCSSKYKGVAWIKSYKKWWAYIGLNGKRTSLGYFDDEAAAGIAYNKAANVLFGEFARINVI